MAMSQSVMRAGDRIRFFYAGAAAMLLVLTLVGFQHFFFQGKAYPGRELAPPIRSLLIAHGLAMALWMSLFVIQPLLVAFGRRNIHRLLGKFGAILALCIAVLGFRLALAATRIAPPDMVIWGLTPVQFMAVPVLDIIVFVVFVGLGLWQRRFPDAHRPMMLMASLSAVGAAVSRIDVLSNLYKDTVWVTVFGPFFMTVIVGGLLLATHRLITRSFSRWFVFGYAGLSVAFAAIMLIATTAAWQQFAHFLLF